ncbi:MAG: hypothetical protein ACK5KO_03890 [Arachnia sp.]
MRQHPAAFLALVVLFLGGCSTPTEPSPGTSAEPGSSAEASRSPTVSQDRKREIEHAPAPKPPGSPSASAAEQAIVCPAGVELPSQADPRGCGPVPEDARDAQGSYRFITPSGNIACSMQDGFVLCEALETTMISEHQGPESGGVCNGYSLDDVAVMACHGDPMLWGSPDGDPATWPALAYGDSVFVNDNVCAVVDTGLTCWNSVSGHGFFLSRGHYAGW